MSEQKLIEVTKALYLNQKKTIKIFVNVAGRFNIEIYLGKSTTSITRCFIFVPDTISTLPHDLNANKNQFKLMASLEGLLAREFISLNLITFNEI